MSRFSETSAAATAGMVAAAFLIAHQVSAKATRDALFLSNFDITALPSMLIGSSLLAIVSVLVTSRILTKLGPARLMPPAFGLSALFLIAEWQLVHYSPRIGAVAVYSHIAIFGSILISGFWSLINERFDPRAARRLIGRIGTGGTLGGLGGGLLAARAADTISVATMIPLLALLHAICAVILLRLRSGQISKGTDAQETPFFAGARVLREQPYMRNLAVLILLGTVSAALIDYVFKARASSYLSDAESFLRFFAYYYTATGLCSVVVQSSLSRVSLKKLGLAKTVGTLPSVVILGSFGAVLLPVLLTAALARGAEAVIRNSLFRSAYEVLYTPVPLAEKRSTKSIIDVGFERLGDTLGGGVTRLILLLGSQAAQSVMLVLALTLGIVGLYVARRIHKGYVSALERSLKAKAVELDLSEVRDKTTRQTVMSLAGFRLDGLRDLPASRSSQTQGDPVPVLTGARVDPTIEKIELLTSGDAKAVRKILERGPVDSTMVPFAINLLAWNEVASDVIKSMRQTCNSITGQLIDHLLNPEQEFSIRRRIPRVLSAASTQRSADGLLLGLGDQRFEVRFQCSRSLAHVCDRNPEIRLDSERVFEAASREVQVDRRVWESQRLLDQFEDSERTTFFEDKMLKERASRSLEHVFTILSLVLPKQPLRIAYRGLHTQDKNLRGTALEYLETILPEGIRESLWPFLEDRREREETAKSRDQILDELMKSHKSIEISLEHIRRNKPSDL